MPVEFGTVELHRQPGDGKTLQVRQSMTARRMRYQIPRHSAEDGESRREVATTVRAPADLGDKLVKTQGGLAAFWLVEMPILIECESYTGVAEASAHYLRGDATLQRKRGVSVP